MHASLDRFSERRKNVEVYMCVWELISEAPGWLLSVGQLHMHVRSSLLLSPDSALKWYTVAPQQPPRVLCPHTVIHCSDCLTSLYAHIWASIVVIISLDCCIWSIVGPPWTFIYVGLLIRSWYCSGTLRGIFLSVLPWGVVCVCILYVPRYM